MIIGGDFLMKSRFKILVSLILISQIFLMACGSLETSYNDKVIEKSKSSKKELPNKEDIIEAYINGMNKITWLSADDYDEVMKQDSLEVPMDYKIYLSVEQGDTVKNDRYNYDFVYKLDTNNESDEVLFSSMRISYCREFSCFMSECSYDGPPSGTYDEVQEELENMEAVFLFETVIKFPKPFIPEIKITEEKKNMLKTMKSKIKELSKNIYGEGIYKVYIWDFSDADTETRVLIINKNKKIMAEYPFDFYDEEGKVDIHVPLGVHVNIEEPMDYDVGSIKYYELFQMFSAEVFECEI